MPGGCCVLRQRRGNSTGLASSLSLRNGEWWTCAREASGRGGRLGSVIVGRVASAGRESVGMCCDSHLVRVGSHHRLARGHTLHHATNGFDQKQPDATVALGTRGSSKMHEISETPRCDRKLRNTQTQPWHMQWHTQGSESVWLSCSPSPSWPSRSRALVSLL